MTSSNSPKSGVGRRQFVAGASAAFASLGLTPRAAAQDTRETPAAPAPANGERKTVLFLGGTGFLGPHTVRACLARGWEVTLFNRGRTNTQLFPDLEKLVGDRDPDRGEGLKALEGDRRWDLVIDTSAYVPRITDASTVLLKGRCDRYLNVSTVSVYASMEAPDQDESAELATVEDETTEDVNRYYGALKALCEQAAEANLPGQVFTVRPGLIVGPDDPTHRFTYWPVRVREGGEVLAPGNIDDPVQYIDVRDLAEFMVHGLDEGLAGIYNAVGPDHGQTIAGLVYGCRAATTSDARFTWVPMEEVQQLGLRPWSDIPMWTGGMGIDRIDGRKAWAAGLTCRSLADTVTGTLESWDAMTEAQKSRPWGMSRDRERDALAKLPELRAEASSDAAPAEAAETPADAAGSRRGGR